MKAYLGDHGILTVREEPSECHCGHWDCEEDYAVQIKLAPLEVDELRQLLIDKFESENA